MSVWAGHLRPAVHPAGSRLHRRLSQSRPWPGQARYRVEDKASLLRPRPGTVVRVDVPASFRFSLGTLNLHCGRDQHGRPFSVLAAIRALNTDVVVLQENWRPAGGGDELADIAARLGYPAPL